MIDFIKGLFEKDQYVVILVCAIKGVVIPLIPLNLVAFKVLFERKVIGWMQERPGPNRVGPWGVLQGFVDAVKLLFKEDLMPRGANRFLFNLAPVLVIVVAFLAIGVIPFGPHFEVAGHTFALAMTELDLALVFFFAIGTLSVYGLVLGGWASNNKWSLLGGLRAAAQMVSYEITLSMAVVGVLLLSGTFSLYEIVGRQAGGFGNWHLWQQPLACMLFFIAMVAETNRLPFDMPEGESELTGGFHTEYSTMKFSMFFMGEYVSIFTMAAMFATLFLGGYHGPISFTLPSLASAPWLTGVICGFFWILLKIGFIFFVFVWIRGTLPRVRYDQLMSLGWKILFPLALLNLIATALVIAYFNDVTWLKVAAFGIGLGSVTLHKTLLFGIGVGGIVLIDVIVSTYRRRTLHVA